MIPDTGAASEQRRLLGKRPPEWEGKREAVAVGQTTFMPLKVVSRRPGVISHSSYLLDGVVGEQELVAGVPERLVGSGVDPKGGALAPGEGADLSPGETF